MSEQDRQYGTRRLPGTLFSLTWDSPVTVDEFMSRDSGWRDTWARFHVGVPLPGDSHRVFVLVVDDVATGSQVVVTAYCKVNSDNGAAGRHDRFDVPTWARETWDPREIDQQARRIIDDVTGVPREVSRVGHVRGVVEATLKDFLHRVDRGRTVSLTFATAEVWNGTQLRVGHDGMHVVVDPHMTDSDVAVLVKGLLNGEGTLDVMTMTTVVSTGGR